MDIDRRLDETGITRGAPISIIVDGQPLQAYEGETVAAALMAAGTRRLRTTSLRGEPRGLYCGMGVCFDCVMTIDGRPNVRTCQMPVASGMQIQTQTGDGHWLSTAEGGNAREV